MQIKFLSIVSLFLLSLSCNENQSNFNAETTTFKVEIIQNGNVIPIKNNLVKLQKAPFKYRITLYGETEYLSVSPSFGKYYYDYPEDKNIFECNNDDLENCRFVAIKTGNEALFNTKKSLYVGGSDYQLNWYFKREDYEHRYDENVTITDEYIIAEKTIENIIDIEARSNNKGNSRYTIEEIQRPIYMVFATSFYESGMDNPKELQREKFIIEFE